MAGAPEGNKNSCKSNRLWAETIKRVVAQSDPQRLRKIAEALLDKAESGDLAAIKELGDRLDGKAAQSVALSGSVSMRRTVEMTDEELADIAAGGSVGTPE